MRIGVPLEYDVFQFEHQLPGGMMGTLRNQLAELKQEYRLDDVLEEMSVIRWELGYPIMGTPYSQIVGVQALFNVTSGGRYKIVPDEIIKYVLGFYGEPDGTIDPNIKDKILSLPKAKWWMSWKPPEVTVEDLRKLEPGLSDDELLVKLINPQEEFKKKLNVLYGKTQRNTRGSDMQTSSRRGEE
jgi:oxaloacetate decarboxylase alpha subunit